MHIIRSRNSKNTIVVQCLYALYLRIINCTQRKVLAGNTYTPAWRAFSTGTGIDISVEGKTVRSKVLQKWAVTVTVVLLLPMVALAEVATISTSSNTSRSNDTNNTITNIHKPMGWYVDMRNGFSLKQPAGMVPVTNIVSNNLWPGIKGWSLIKIPPSQEIIRFVPGLPKKPQQLHRKQEQGGNDLLDKDVQKNKQTGLIVYLLVTKKQMEIKDVLSARREYWQQYSCQARVVQTHISNSNLHPIACLFVKWHWQATKADNKNIVIKPRNNQANASDNNTGKTENPAHVKTTRKITSGSSGSIGQVKALSDNQDLLLSEYIFQKEKDRYFMLVKIEPWLKQGSSSLPLDSVPAEFNCLSTKQEQNRWMKARKQAQDFLAGLKSQEVTSVLPVNEWYVISRAGKNTGFSYTTSQVGISNKEGGKKKGFTISTKSYFADASDAVSFAFMQGLPVGPMVQNSVPEVFSGPVWLETTSTLGVNLKQEKFDYQIKAAGLTLTLYEEKGSWGKSLLDVEIIKNSVRKTKNIPAVKYDVKDDFYLPWSLDCVLNRLLGPENGEYVFMRYSSRGLCYYSLYVCTKDKDAKGKGTGGKGQETKAGGNNANAQGICCGLTGQMGVQGAVVQTWLGKGGKIIQKRYNNLIMKPAKQELIEKLWPLQYKQVSQTDTYTHRI